MSNTQDPTRRRIGWKRDVHSENIKIKPTQVGNFPAKVYRFGSRAKQRCGGGRWPATSGKLKAKVLRKGDVMGTWVGSDILWRGDYADGNGVGSNGHKATIHRLIKNEYYNRRLKCNGVSSYGNLLYMSF